jgi:hypothetical protein
VYLGINLVHPGCAVRPQHTLSDVLKKRGTMLPHEVARGASRV